MGSELLEDADALVHMEPTVKVSNSNFKSTQKICDGRGNSKNKPAKKNSRKDRVEPHLDGGNTCSNKSNVMKNKERESDVGVVSNISEHVSDIASQEKENILLTDRSDKSSASTVSSLVSRKPQARSEK